MDEDRHVWVRGAGRARLLSTPALLPPVDAHRRLRGPYTFGGAVLSAIVPRLLVADPRVVWRHEAEVLAVAPELSTVLGNAVPGEGTRGAARGTSDRGEPATGGSVRPDPGPGGTAPGSVLGGPGTGGALLGGAVPVPGALGGAAPPASTQVRFHSRLRTLRIANAVADLLAASGAGHTLVVQNAEYADPTDVELLAVCVRQLDPARLRLVVATASAAVSGELAAALAPAQAYGTGLDGSPGLRSTSLDPAPGGAAPAHGDTAFPAAVTGLLTAGSAYRPAGSAGEGTAEPAGPAAAYVRSECLSPDLSLHAAYQRLAPADRAVLHQLRAAELAVSAVPAVLLGALPYHLERGTDPSGAGVRALRVALDRCLAEGFYDAAVDLALRGRVLVDPATRRADWWAFTTAAAISLAALGRPQQARPLYAEALAAAPDRHAGSAVPGRPDEDAREYRADRAARAWISRAVAIAALLADPEQRAVETGLAVAEAHQGDLAQALRLVQDGVASLDSELTATASDLHRSVLRYNRDRAYAALGRLAGAVADYAAVAEVDPDQADQHFDRSALWRRIVRERAELADYDDAIRLSPPFARHQPGFGGQPLEEAPVGSFTDHEITYHRTGEPGPLPLPRAASY